MLVHICIAAASQQTATPAPPHAFCGIHIGSRSESESTNYHPHTTHSCALEGVRQPAPTHVPMTMPVACAEVSGRTLHARVWSSRFYTPRTGVCCGSADDEPAQTAHGRLRARTSARYADSAPAPSGGAGTRTPGAHATASRTVVFCTHPRPWR